MNWWMKLRALPVVWSNMDLLLASVALNKMSAQMLEANAGVMKQGLATLQAQQAEIDRMNRVAEQDAKMLLAYSRWCEKNGCAPSSSDLMGMVK